MQPSHFLSSRTAARFSKDRKKDRNVSVIPFTMTPAAAATLSGDAFRALFPEEVRNPWKKLERKIKRESEHFFATRIKPPVFLSF